MKRLILLACLCLATALPGGGPLAAGAGTADEDVVLIVSGRIAAADGEASGTARFDRAALRELPQHEVVTSTVWTDGVSRFVGPRLADLLDAVGAEGTTLRARAADRYTVEIPVTDARRYDVILALERDGEPLPDDGMGPIWIVYPQDAHPELDRPEVHDRWIWQLSGIEVR